MPDTISDKIIEFIMRKVGIHSASFYFPSIYVDIKDLALRRNIEYQKLSKGLGLNKMSFPDCDEDSASFAANALIKLIDSNNINPKEIGRIYLGTESSIDSSKPTISYAVEIVEEILKGSHGKNCFKNTDIVDLTFACVGGVDAQQNCLDWVRNEKQRKAIVIASDQAKYELGSTGEYTQGSGAVAFLITEEPDLLEILDTWGIATKGVGDFFKPRRTYNKIDLFKEASRLLSKEVDDELLLKILESSNSKFWSNSNSKVEVFKEEPIFDGKFSNECYQERILDALNHYENQEKTDFFSSSQYLIFHLPYAYHGRRIIFKKWLSWITKNGEVDQLYKEIGNESDEKLFVKKASKSKLYLDFVKNKIIPGEIASSQIGNMYSASIFMSLLSLFTNAFKNQIEITNNIVGFISYGSGSKAKVFKGIVQSGWKEQIKGLKLFEILESRKKIKIETYEKLHKNQISNPLTSDKNVVKLSKIGSGEFNLGLRRYKYNQK